MGFWQAAHEAEDAGEEAEEVTLSRLLVWPDTVAMEGPKPRAPALRAPPPSGPTLLRVVAFISIAGSVYKTEGKKDRDKY